ncbi:MAG: hypothetical protein OXN18_16215 [Gemmatimonadota bacterium]|nr:hypothetical protein [Gemmatimonadota bacterium]
MWNRRSTRTEHRFHRHALAAMVLALLGACATANGARTNPMEGDARDSEEIEILVHNNHFSQATVYTVRGGASMRLGIVPGKDEATFRTRWPLPNIQLRVKFLAGSDFVTETMPVGPGEILELTILAR